MGFEFNILWLDDDWGHPLNDAKITSTSTLISEYLKERGFDCNIIKVSNESDINNNLNNRTSLFVSDYNLSDNYKGIDFMKNMRKKLFKQEILLYTNGGVDEIRNELHKILDTNDGLDILQRFSFSTTSDLGIKLQNIIDLIISKSQELNMLRGLYVAEAGNVEEKTLILLKRKLINEFNDLEEKKLISLIKAKIVSDKTKMERYEKYCLLINKKDKKKIMNYFECLNFDCKFSFMIDIYLEVQNHYPEIKEDMKKIHNLRNKLAHGVECVDSEGNYYLENKGDKIYDSDIEGYRVDLKDYIEKISRVLDSFSEKNEEFLRKGEALKSYK